MKFLAPALLFAAALNASMAASAKKQLADSVLSSYKPPQDSVTVDLKVSVDSVSAFTEENRHLKLQVKIIQSWSDSALKWSPGDHGNIDTLTLPIAKIWHPSNYVTLKDGKKEVASVSADGNVTWTALVDEDVDCRDSYDTTNFPFEELACHAKIPKVQDKGAVKSTFIIGNEEIDVKTMKKSPLAIVAKGSLSFSNVSDYDSPTSDDEDSDGEADEELVLKFTIKRGNIEFYTHFIKFPFMILAFFTAFPFFMEPNSQWKVPFASAVFLAFFLFGILVFQVMGSAIKYALTGAPLLSIFWRYNTIQSGFSIVQSAMNFDMCHKKTDPGQCMKKVFITYLAPVLLCGCFKTCADKKAAAKRAKAAEKPDEEVAMTKAAHDSSVRVEVQDEASDSASSKAEKIAQDWFVIVSVIDRLCAIAFMTHAIVMIVLYLP